MIMPKLDFTRLFRIGAGGTITEDDSRPGHPLQHTAMRSDDSTTIKQLSDIGKLNYDSGDVVNQYDRVLPEIEWTAFIISAAHNTPITPDKSQMPFQLKAVGLIDPYLIFNRKNGPVSSKVEIIP